MAENNSSRVLCDETAVLMARFLFSRNSAISRARASPFG
jgi:hypothetical protein